jgi:hypothetical protein
MGMSRKRYPSMHEINTGRFFGGKPFVPGGAGAAFSALRPLETPARTPD